jgi:hypothetical protein
MRTAYAPKTHTQLASVNVGVPYGHVPGHQYRDVDVVISTPTRSRQGDSLYRCHIVESWGSAQGRDEEHGRREVIGRGPSIQAACSNALCAAKQAGITEGYLAEAVSQALDAAEEAIAEQESDEPVYRVGCIDGTHGGKRPLYRVDTDMTLAWVESDAGPALIGDMTEAQARDRFPEAFSGVE